MTDSRGDLHIHLDRTGDWNLPEPLILRGVALVLEAEGVIQGDLSITLVDDEGIQALNREYLGRDRPTDVIAFALHKEGEPLVGDVYLGHQQALRQARETGISAEEELLRLAVHGTLHVLGYDHPPGDDRWSSPMFRRQEEVVARILADPPPG